MPFFFPATAPKNHLSRGTVVYNNLSKAFFSFGPPFLFLEYNEPAALTADNIQIVHHVLHIGHHSLNIIAV